MLQNRKEDIVLGRDPHALIHGPRSVSESAGPSLQRVGDGKALLCYTRDVRGGEGGIYQQHKKR